jgi:hypothetical protein
MACCEAAGAEGSSWVTAKIGTVLNPCGCAKPR